MKVGNFLKLLSYVVIMMLLVISSVFIGIPYYIKYSIEKYSQLHELEVNVGSTHYNWRIGKALSLEILFSLLLAYYKLYHPAFALMLGEL